MTKFINVRGCNGSGKTTLLRLLATDPACRTEEITVFHDVKAKDGSGKVREAHKPIPVTYVPGGIAILGDYTLSAGHATTAGCDRIKTQEAAKNALEGIALLDPSVRVVLFEGVVVSTIYGPWRDWSQAHGGMVWAFLDTPLSICLDRIQNRNGGKPINEKLVADKHKTIARVREKALADGEEVLTLSWKNPVEELATYMEAL